MAPTARRTLSQHDPAFTRRVARRHANGQRSARENVADLVDPESFLEYGQLQIAGQRKRRSLEVHTSTQTEIR